MKYRSVSITLCSVYLPYSSRNFENYNYQSTAFGRSLCHFPHKIFCAVDPFVFISLLNTRNITWLETDNCTVGMYQTTLISERKLYSYTFHYFIFIRFNAFFFVFTLRTNSRIFRAM